MTNSLHRYGDTESFRDDYVVFAMCSRGKNDENAVARLRQFLEMALQFGPVNLGDARHGGAMRPSRSMSPLAHWRRNAKPDFRAAIPARAPPPPTAPLLPTPPPPHHP